VRSIIVWERNQKILHNHSQKRDRFFNNFLVISIVGDLPTMRKVVPHRENNRYNISRQRTA